MADRKYVDESGVQSIASNVNKRLKVVSVMPTSADNGAVRLYIGETTASYKQGSIYQYDATLMEWKTINAEGEDVGIAVSLTAPSAVDIDEKLANYPTGYTFSNSYISAAFVVVDGCKYALNNNSAALFLASDGIHGVVIHPDYLSGTYTAILKKTPN